MTDKFKVGDRVVCAVESYGLAKYGEAYEVTEVSGGYMSIKESDRFLCYEQEDFEDDRVWNSPLMKALE